MKIRESGMPDESYWETFFDPAYIFKMLNFDGSVKDAVEFGSGYGTFTIPASKIISGTLYAFDIEPDMIELLGDKITAENVSNIKLIRKDFVTEGTGLNDNSVDYVMLFNILHAENPDVLLNETKRILRPGGKIGVIHWIYSASTPRGPSMDIRPTPSMCINWIKDAGFEIQEKVIPLPPYHYGIVGIKKMSD